MTGLLIACLVLNILCLFYIIIGCFVEIGNSIVLSLLKILLVFGTHILDIIVVIKCLRLML